MISRLQKLGMKKALQTLTREELELYCYVHAVRVGELTEMITGEDCCNVEGYVASTEEHCISYKEGRIIEEVSAKVTDMIQNYERSHN